jgi:hypothetical protein
MATGNSEYALKKRAGGSGMNRQEMADQAAAATKSSHMTGQTGNCIVIFTMFLLQDLMAQQLVNPITNFNNIIALSSAIAALNASIKI